jgi:diacylglycerol kinase family enzyme
LDPGRPLVIVNPRSGGGLSESRWARVRGALADGLGELDSAFTTAPRDATEIARREAAGGRRFILALGGDGTISEVADGVLAAGAGATTEIGLIPRGTGGDFRRTLELPEEVAAAAQRRPASTGAPLSTRGGCVPRRRRRRGGAPLHQRRIVRFLQRGGAPCERVEQALRRQDRVPGATLRELFAHDNHDIWLTTDGQERRRSRVMMAAVGNGRFFGGGMKICPDALIDDGVFDLVTVGDLTTARVVANIGRPVQRKPIWSWSR